MSFRTQTNRTNQPMKRQLDHYIHLIWRKLWFILPTCIVVIAAWFVAINKLGVAKPQLSATAILHLMILMNSVP